MAKKTIELTKQQAQMLFEWSESNAQADDDSYSIKEPPYEGVTREFCKKMWKDILKQLKRAAE